jgi:hypothetical protein
VAPGPQLDEARAIVEQSAHETGRDPSLIGMEGSVDWKGNLDQLLDDIGTWTAAGATHLG